MQQSGRKTLNLSTPRSRKDYKTVIDLVIDHNLLASLASGENKNFSWQKAVNDLTLPGLHIISNVLEDFRYTFGTMLLYMYIYIINVWFLSSFTYKLVSFKKKVWN